MAPSRRKDTDPSQKSLKLLEQSLAKLSQESKDSQKVKSPRTSTRKRPIKVNENYPKISTWLTTGQVKRQKTEAKFAKCALDITVEKPSTSKMSESPKKSKKSKPLKRNASFERYGVVIPSFEKILADQKKFEKHKDKVKQFDDFDEDSLLKPLAADCLQEQEEFTGELLDCRHLSIEELDEAFERHSKTLSRIMSGKIYLKRHDLFHRKFTEQSNRQLQCSSSLVVFTQDQNDRLLDLMKLKLDPEDQQLNYFFKVLLPELCLLIFMDVHHMSKTDATEYLDKRPIDF